MKIAFIAAGAANMYCGSCLRDNAVASAMLKLGEDVLMIPLYTPMRLERDDVSSERVFYGGVSVYLQQKFGFFRRSAALDRLLNSRSMLSLASRMAGMTNPKDLGDLTLSTLRGDEGNQRREVLKLAEWLAGEIKPDIINLPNSMLVGVARELKRATGAPVVCSLTGEDLFLLGLDEPWKSRAIETLRERARDVDAFVAISGYYAEFMRDLLAVPAEKIRVVPVGLDSAGFGRKGPRPQKPFTVGYLARIDPEKGLHALAEAFAELKKLPGAEDARLRAAGWLGPQHRDYLERVRAQLRAAGLEADFEYVGEVNFEEKLRFLDSLSALSVPTVYRDPKGLFVLEALAHGVPVVQPRHGAFPEMIEATGGGLLSAPGDARDLAAKLHAIMTSPAEADRMAEAGQRAVRERFTSEAMARATLAVYHQFVPRAA